MRRNTGRSAALAVLACLLVIGSTLAVAPGGVAAQQAVEITGDVRFTDAGELQVDVEARNASEGPFTGGNEDVTIAVGGASVTRTDTLGENESTYSYSVPLGVLVDQQGLPTTDLSDAQVTVSHGSGANFTRRVDLRYVRFDDDSGRFAGDGTLRFDFDVGLGLAPGSDVATSVAIDNNTRDVTGTYQRDSAANTSYVVFDRGTLTDLGVLDDPRQLTVSAGGSYVKGSATVDVASAAAERTGGERLADGSGARFGSPLFVDGRTYVVTVSADGARYLQTIAAGERTLTVDSRAVAAESGVSLTVERAGNTLVDGRSVEFATTTVNGTADGATITFDSLPDRVSGANVSAVWVEARDGVERYEAGLNATTRTLTLSDAESLQHVDANRTALLVQFEGATPLHATVALQSDGGGATTGTDQNQSGTFGVPIGLDTPLLLAGVIILGFILGAIVVIGVLRVVTSDTTSLSIGPFGSSKPESPGESPGGSPPVETAEVSVEVVDEATGKTYPQATRVVARPKNSRSAGPTGSTRGSGPGGATGPAGQSGPASLGGVNTDDTERIDLRAGEGEAELEYGTWIFEVEENGETIGQRTHDLEYGFESDHIGLGVDPHVVEAVVTGGPDREPLGGATVEARVDAGNWSRQKPTNPEGRVRFEVPRSATKVAVTAKPDGLPPAESQVRAERAAQEGVTLRVADETGAMTVETTVGDRPWPEVDVRITPVSEEAKAYTDEGTVTTKSGGRRTIEGLPAGEYEVAAHPQLQSVDTTAAVERVTIGDGDTVEVELPIGISYSMSTAQRERMAEIGDRIEGLASASNRDVAIPQYYGTVLSAVLDLIEEIESSPERAAGAEISPDAAVEALLDATEAGIRAVDGAMSERRNVKLFGACESMPPASVAWSGTATLDAFLDRMSEGGDHERRALRDRLKAVDGVLDEQWGEVNELAPARKVHDRIGELARETGSLDSELAVVAQTYVGICLLDAVEEIFEHDALVDRLDSGSF